jgi:hypothetical protein
LADDLASGIVDKHRVIRAEQTEASIKISGTGSRGGVSTIAPDRQIARARDGGARRERPSRRETPPPPR